MHPALCTALELTPARRRRTLRGALVRPGLAAVNELRTPRLRLRQWRDDDLEPFAAMGADPEVMRCYPAPLSRRESDALAGRFRAGIAERGFGVWAVEVV